ncbi:2,3,4,5-tetrahydropyridine-2,6-dicarboxylate N-succinyltransferase [Zymobacter sp. IVIA_5232.4 C2]|uniref:2,3,4,5-tetrahydropyridine-2,6-dicarboxylate N-succinyltransferase n=1 Tax=Zymobacter sp. IVIA_5232.4 C2 TaxID=3394855 RepID=UPI0039C43F77
MLSLGLGIGTQNLQGEWLEVMFPAPLLSPSEAVTTAVARALDVTITKTTNISVHQEQCPALASALAALTHDAALKQEVQPLIDLVEALEDSQRPLVATFIVADEAPQSVPEVYLKLQLISHRLSRPHSLNLDGMFGVLKNVAWTSEGAIDIEELPARQLKARLAGRTLSVDCVDKFPKMTDYVVPTGVRIADTSRVRLGAYLGEGTTVMHEGFCNFNAGTEGPCMIEGRISAGVFIGAHSDLGGGSSTMGTLSGGGKQVISVGEKCLIGANAGIGIPLGNRCTVESGLYITAGAKVAVLDSTGEVAKIVAARELAGQDDLLFLRHSQTGRLECRTNKTAVALNESLHAHN